MEMKKRFYYFISVLLIYFACAFPSTTNAQGYISASTYLGGRAQSKDEKMVVVNGETYLLGGCYGSATTQAYPTTLGSAYNLGVSTSSNDITVTKLDANLNIVWSRFLGSSSPDYGSDLIVSNGNVYVAGVTSGNNFPVTNNSSLTGTVGTDENVTYTKLNAATGAIQFSTYVSLGGNPLLEVSGGIVAVLFDKRILSSLGSQIGLTVYNDASNTQALATSYSGSGDEYMAPLYTSTRTLAISGNYLHFMGTSTSLDLPVTDGSVNATGGESLFYMKVDITTGAVNICKYISGTADKTVTPVKLALDNGMVYLGVETEQPNMPTTDGSNLHSINTAAYIMAMNASTGNCVFAKYIGATTPSSNATYFKTLIPYAGKLIIVGGTNSNDFPVTNGTGTSSNFAGYFIKINATTGNVEKSLLIDGDSFDSFEDAQVVNGDTYLVGITSSQNYPVTNGSYLYGFTDNIFTKVNFDGEICFSTYLGGSNLEPGSTEYPKVGVYGNNAYLFGNTQSSDFPVTNNTTRSFSTRHNTVTKFNFSPAVSGVSDVTSPATQSACKNGLASVITAPSLTIDGASLPTIYRNSVPYTQTSMQVSYKWQRADAATGPWVDIPDAVTQNYQPQVGLVNQYYRRITSISNCGNITLSTSSVAEVLVNANTAPIINVGGPYNTCTGTGIVIGGSPTATGVGGATISSYSWTPTLSITSGATTGNPTVNPTTNTIYTVTVTDNNGCTQIAQTLVNVNAANAGPDVGFCSNVSGSTVQIGGVPLAGLSGATYSWSSVSGDPVSTLSCTNCAQPFVTNLTQTTTYRLTMTIPKTGGGTCTYTDDVVVSYITPPTATAPNGFAGPDITMCHTTASMGIGTTAQTGYTYTWAPGDYLTDNHTMPTTFQPGAALNMPTPNPYVYLVTALKGGCTFVDTVKAYIIKASAGQDGCGPRYIGVANPTPGFPVVYSWTKTGAADGSDGSATFTSASNIANPTVSSSTVATTFTLNATYNGVTCTDQVVVPPCGCSLDVTVSAANSCPSYNLNNGDVKLEATSGIAGTTFSWSPQAGLNTYTGASVYLTDNVARTYTVTATSPDGTTCTQNIAVNSPSFTLPVFTTQNLTTCPGTSVNIGQPPVAGYSYQWSGNTQYLSSTTSSNPTATVNSTNSFHVLVTDIGSGCTTRDTATVTISGFPANPAGEDMSFCGTSTNVQLGITPIAGMIYSWTPATTYTPSSNVANPVVSVATTTTFILTMTNPATGCSLTDSVNVIIKPAVPTFSFTNATFCPGTSGALPLPQGPTGTGYTYSWNPSMQVINPTSNGSQPPTATSATTTNPRPQTAMTYTLTVTNSSGCTGAATYTLTPSSTLPVAGSNRAICLGESTLLGGTAESGSTYSWSPATGLSSTTVSNPTFTPTAAGITTFTVSKTDAGGCVTTATVTVTVNSFTLPVLASTTVCQNSCVQIGFDPSLAQSGATYIWTPSTGLSSTSITNPIACVGTANQSYTLTGIGANGCTATQNVMVGVNPTPAPTITAADVSACQGQAGVQLSASASPAGTYNYVWSPNNGTLSNIYSATPTVSTANVGTFTYQVTVTNTATGCASVKNVTLRVTDCGYVPGNNTLGNLVWYDANKNGIADNGEAGVPGVTVYLYADANTDGLPDGPAISSTTTDANGNYLFTGLGNGNYIASIKLPSGYSVAPTTSTSLTPTNNTNNDNNGVSQAGMIVYSKTLTLVAGANPINDGDADANTNLTLDFGLVPVNLGDYVWMDNNADGKQDATEPGVSGVTVTLYRNGADGVPGTADDVLVGTTVTDAYGYYEFNYLPATDQTDATTIAQTSYNVRFTPPANYTFTTQTNTADVQDNTGSDANALGISHTVNLTKSNMTIDAGLIFNPPTILGSIGDQVWFDANSDGLNNNSEAGVAGITVQLLNASGQVIASTVTDANGYYLFSGLPAGSYQVKVSAPAGTTFTSADASGSGAPGSGTDGTNDSDVSSTTGLTSTITLATGQHITNVDAGIKNITGTNTGSLGDFVWYDLDHDGVQDAGEPGIPGVAMTLYQPGPDGVIGGGDDVLVGTTTTDINGYYVFNNLTPGGKYFVVATPPTGYTTSPTGGTTDITKDNNFAANTNYSGKSVSGLYTLPSTGVVSDMTIDLGLYNSASNLGSLGDKVWIDANANGLQDSGEPGVQGVTVSLLNGSGTPVNNPVTGQPYVVMTDINGYYKFVDLPAGTYQVKFSNLPSGYVFTQPDASGSGNAGSATDGANDSDPSASGLTSTITLAAGQNITTVDAGLVKGIPAGTATLGDRVWYDTDGDGIQDVNEFGVPGVKVELLDASGNVVNVPGTSTPYVVYTNGIGEYVFTGLPAGSYTVRFSNLPTGYTSSPAGASGSTESNDSDASFTGSSLTSTTTATTGVIVLSTGQDYMDVDMGIVPPASYINSLGDYVWIDTNNDGLQSTGEPAVPGVVVNLYSNGSDGLPNTSDDVFIGSTVTDNSGKYIFTGLADGNYNVGFTAPAGYGFTTTTNGTATGSDADKTGRTGTVALDPTHNSLTGVSDMDVDAGLVTTRAALGDYVWYDGNGDGLQTSGEPGISGVLVTLYNSSTGDVLATAVTDANGYYLFPNLDPAISYKVGFSNKPSGLSFTTKEASSLSANGSNVNTSGSNVGKTDAVTLAAGTVNLTVDAGLTPVLASLGNFVWSDYNANGIQDIGEQGVPGVLVSLYNATGTLVGTALTDGNGGYLFTNLVPGDYYVTFGNIPAGSNFTTQTNSTATGSDANASTGQTITFTIAPNQQYLDIDAGIISPKPLPVELLNFVAVGKECSAVLNWRSAIESNFAYYEVERSINGIQYNSIGIVRANGSNSSYELTDNVASRSNNYYRLKMIDKDGKFSYSSVAKVSINCSAIITISPTLIQDVTKVYGLSGGEVLIVHNNLGQQLLKKVAVNHSETVNLSGFVSGVYHVTVISDGKAIFSAKVVKQ